MEVIYTLRNDTDAIAQMQHGSLSGGPAGLRVTHGLVGSDEWWTHIESGSLPVFLSQGVVSGFWPGQWGDGPAEFEVQQSDGHKTHWLCMLEPKQAKHVFIVGRPVIVQYVNQLLRHEFAGKRESKVTIAICLD